MKKLLRENMSSHLITIGWKERMDTAFKRMQENRLRHLPVVNEIGEAIGMLSDRDVQRAMNSTITHELISHGTSETISFDPNARVKDYMNWPIKAVELNTELRVVAERMIQEKVSSLLVYSGEQTVGIITAEDLMRVLMSLLSDPKTGNEWTLENILGNAFSQLHHTLV